MTLRTRVTPRRARVAGSAASRALPRYRKGRICVAGYEWTSSAPLGGVVVVATAAAAGWWWVVGVVGVVVGAAGEGHGVVSQRCG